MGSRSRRAHTGGSLHNADVRGAPHRWAAAVAAARAGACTLSTALNAARPPTWWLLCCCGCCWRCCWGPQTAPRPRRRQPGAAAAPAAAGARPAPPSAGRPALRRVSGLVLRRGGQVRVVGGAVLGRGQGPVQACSMCHSADATPIARPMARRRPPHSDEPHAERACRGRAPPGAQRPPRRWSNLPCGSLKLGVGEEAISVMAFAAAALQRPAALAACSIHSQKQAFRPVSTNACPAPHCAAARPAAPPRPPQALASRPPSAQSRPRPPLAGACGGAAGGSRRPPAGGAGSGGSSSSSRGGPRGCGAPALHPRLAPQGACAAARRRAAAAPASAPPRGGAAGGSLAQPASALAALLHSF